MERGRQHVWFRKFEVPKRKAFLRNSDPRNKEWTADDQRDEEEGAEEEREQSKPRRPTKPEEDGGAEGSDAVAQGGRRLRGCCSWTRHLRRAHVPPQEPCVQGGLAHCVTLPSRPHRRAARGSHHKTPKHFRRASHGWNRVLLWNVLHCGLS